MHTRTPITTLIRARLLAAAGLLMLASSAAPVAAQTQAQAQDPHAWEGIWSAEQTIITLRVTRSGDMFMVEPIESGGLIWTTRNGVIHQDTATIEVEYQGVIGKLMVQMIDGQTAVAHAMSCQPDYHVLCALVKNQQARFLKLEALPALD